jgi:hypothetical protein
VSSRAGGTSRYYDPTIGRLTATDPLADLQRHGGLDAHGCAHGDPHHVHRSFRPLPAVERRSRRRVTSGNPVLAEWEIDNPVSGGVGGSAGGGVPAAAAMGVEAAAASSTVRAARNWVAGVGDLITRPLCWPCDADQPLHL